MGSALRGIGTGIAASVERTFGDRAKGKYAKIAKERKEMNEQLINSLETSLVLPGKSEIGGVAAAAQARAMVESRYYMAMKNPRSWDQVRQDILRECQRPRFAANKSTHYHKPIGRGGVEGLGIRFVEVALRCMRNVLIEVEMIYEDETKEVQRVTVTDLENNVTYPMDVKVGKTVERSRPDSDGAYISVRRNSKGIEVFTVAANDDEILNKRMALISKAVRVLGLRIIPGDIKDEAEEMILSIRKNTAARDPDGERKRMLDAYAGIGVRAIDLALYMGHDLGMTSPQEIVDLMGLYGAIRDGEATWKSVLEGQEKGVVDVEVSPPATAPHSTSPVIPEPLSKWIVEEGVKEKDFCEYLQSVGWLAAGEYQISQVGESRRGLIEQNKDRFLAGFNAFWENQHSPSLPPQKQGPDF